MRKQAYHVARLVGKVAKFYHRGSLMSCTPFPRAAKPVWANQLTRWPCLMIQIAKTTTSKIANALSQSPTCRGFWGYAKLQKNAIAKTKFIVAWPSCHVWLFGSQGNRLSWHIVRGAVTLLVPFSKSSETSQGSIPDSTKFLGGIRQAALTRPRNNTVTLQCTKSLHLAPPNLSGHPLVGMIHFRCCAELWAQGGRWVDTLGDTSGHTCI